MHVGVTAATGNPGRRVVAGPHGARHRGAEYASKAELCITVLELRFQRVLG
jgi:hypothetical protein